MPGLLLTSLLVLVLALGQTALAQAATVHTWTDRQGVFHASDRPPPEGATGTKALDIRENGSAGPDLHGGGKVAPGMSGTGFVVSDKGHVLTNWHVVASGRQLKTHFEGRTVPLTLVRSDMTNDLALLKLHAPARFHASFRGGRPIRSGDSVVALGYPLQGILAPEANVTTGVVSAMAGRGNDVRFIQISAPVQPGNSGGPLLDQSGNVVGMVTAQLLPSIKQGKAFVPQNVNFAINADLVRAFLRQAGVDPAMGASDEVLSAADIGERAKRFTLRIECGR